MGDKAGNTLNSRGTFRSPFLSVRIQEDRPDEEDTIIDFRGANGADHQASSSAAGGLLEWPVDNIALSSCRNAMKGCTLK